MGGETTRVENRGETTRGETTREETSWGRNVLLPAIIRLIGLSDYQREILRMSPGVNINRN